MQNTHRAEVSECLVTAMWHCCQRILQFFGWHSYTVLWQQSKWCLLRQIRPYWIGASWFTSASKVNAWNAPCRDDFTSRPDQSVAPKHIHFKPLQLWWLLYRESIMFRNEYTVERLILLLYANYWELSNIVLTINSYMYQPECGFLN